MTLGDHVTQFVSLLIRCNFGLQGDVVVSIDDGTLAVWDMKDFKVVARSKPSGTLHLFVFSLVSLTYCPLWHLLDNTFLALHKHVHKECVWLQPSCSQLGYFLSISV